MAITWEAMVKAYPALGTKVNGEEPMRFAVEEFAAGRCATTITARDLKLDKECAE